MILQPHYVYIVDQVRVRYAVDLQVFFIQNIYFSDKGYAELFTDQSLDGIFIRALTQDIRLDSQAAIKPLSISAKS